MGQSRAFGGTSASERFWRCQQCNRHVPTRQDRCMCGGTRPEPAAPPDAPTAAPPPPPPARPADAAAAYAFRPSAASASLEDLVYPNERSLFVIGLLLSISFWLALLVGTLGLAL